MKIALIQLDYHIGNFSKNTANIISQIENAQKNGVDLAVFSELAVCGYPPIGLLENKEFINSCDREINRIARVCTDIGVIIGCPSIKPGKKGKLLFNSAFFMYEGEIKKVFHKSILSNFGVFDEYKYFEPGSEFYFLDFMGKKIAVTICEDLLDEQLFENGFRKRNLYSLEPVEKIKSGKPDLIINLSASPFSHNLTDIKKNILISHARKFKLPLIYINQTGAQAQLIFDGGSMAIDRTGQIIEQLNYFTPDTRIIDTGNLDGECSVTAEVEMPDKIELIHDALITGIKGYFHKLNLQKAVLGLSGGLDSAVTLVLASRALGKKNVHSLLLPSQYSSEHSVSDSIKLSENLDVSYDIIDIRKAYYAISELLSPLFKNLPDNITEENIQARIRGLLLMAYSNKFGHIVLNTSNKSEAAVGYGTLYGDMVGGLCVLGDVYKTEVYKLAEFINKNKVIIPENIILKTPSAELRPGQKDSDSLPEYDLLDKFLFEYIEHQKSEEYLLKAGFDSTLMTKIIHMVKVSEYKRYQSPPTLRVSSRPLGTGRNIPLVAHW